MFAIDESTNVYPHLPHALPVFVNVTSTPRLRLTEDAECHEVILSAKIAEATRNANTRGHARTVTAHAYLQIDRSRMKNFGSTPHWIFSVVLRNIPFVCSIVFLPSPFHPPSVCLSLSLSFSFFLSLHITSYVLNAFYIVLNAN